jgi:hypothetical protein
LGVNFGSERLNYTGKKLRIKLIILKKLTISIHNNLGENVE